MSGKTSDRLKEKKEEILHRWEMRSTREVSSAKGSASLALRDSLPQYLDHLSEALATHRSHDVQALKADGEESTRIGRQHGADRAANIQYALTEVIFEYHLLRQVIFQVLEAVHPLNPLERDIILDSIEEVVNDAAVHFSEIHTALQQQFVNTLTHDLKIPITTAKMNAELILRLSDRPETCLTSANRIIASQNRLTAMIHDLLDTSRLRAGEPLSLQFSQCDLRSALQESISEMSVIHGDRFVVESKGDFMGCWSQDGMRRAFENLLENAVKYGSPQSLIRITLMKRGKAAVVISVHNEGDPIPENELKGLFRPFSRSKSAEKGSQVGWGLGLTLIEGVVHAHHGKVRVVSEMGKGTCFILDIPLVQSRRAA